MNKKVIGKRLKKLRGDKTIVSVAETIGITPSALVNYETGIRVPRDEIKIKLAKYYNVSVEDLFF